MPSRGLSPKNSFSSEVAHRTQPRPTQSLSINNNFLGIKEIKTRLSVPLRKNAGKYSNVVNKQNTDISEMILTSYCSAYGDSLNQYVAHHQKRKHNDLARTLVHP